jgi:hypothetical protein
MHPAQCEQTLQFSLSVQSSLVLQFVVVSPCASWDEVLQSLEPLVYLAPSSLKPHHPETFRL